MNERDLEPEEAAVGLLVDQLDAPGREVPQLVAEVADLVGDVVHSRAAVGQELADRRLVTERGEQLDATRADPDRSRLDALLGDRLTPLELRAEQPAVRLESLVEVLDGDAEMVNPLVPHARG